jgi:hypothetical protein
VEFRGGIRIISLNFRICGLCVAVQEIFELRAITYQLRRLRLHGLIERVPDSFRYRVTEFGLRVALFFTRTYNRILRPGLAAALPTLRAINAPLKRAFDKLDIQLNALDRAGSTHPKNLTHLSQLFPLKLG